MRNSGYPMMGNSKTYGLAAVVGFFAGLVAAAFHYLLDLIVNGRLWLREILHDWMVPGWVPLMIAGASLVCLSLWLVRRFAPEANGSGIPQVEAFLAGTHSLRWQRILPIKFIAGLIAMAPGLVLGREGPTIHMGAACGKMLADHAKVDRQQSHTLTAAGVAAGLGAAFNAPLAGIMLVTEEMRSEFNYSFVSLQSVILASCVALVVSEWWLGQGLQLSLPSVALAPLVEMPLYLLLGIIIGIFGVLFNRLLLLSVDSFKRVHHSLRYGLVAAVGALIGALLWFAPDATGEGEQLLQQALKQSWGLWLLTGLFIVRMLTTVLSYGTGVPGGIFAPLLALGTLIGVAFSFLVHGWLPNTVSSPVMFAVAAMGALFAATVRAPLTGIVLVMELTGALEAGLTIILTCMMATFTAQRLGGQPIYHQLLRRQQPTAG